jgi:hypothetical protein
MATNNDPPPLASDGSDPHQSASPPQALFSGNSNKNGQSQDTLESLVRITLAGFGGSLAGLAQQRQQQPGTANSTSASATSSGTSTSSNNRRRQRPPTASLLLNQKNALGNQPRTWALSCMIFALILETSRRSSPTTSLLQSVRPSDEESLSWNLRVQNTAITAIGDYTLGGTVAGLVGALSTKAMQLPASILASKAGRRPLMVWGLGAGMSLGLVAGLFQAGIDVGNLYLEREQEQQRQSEHEKAK